MENYIMRVFSIPTGMTSAPKSNLDLVISDIPWQDSFVMGQGVDAITGKTMLNALKPAQLTQAQTKSSSTRFTMVEDENTLLSEISLQTSGKYNIEGLILGESVSLVSELQYSELTLTLLAEYTMSFTEYDLLKEPALTDEARALLKDPVSFRQTYGDYFVAGARREASLVALYVCRATSVKSMVDFKLEMKARVPFLFTQSGSEALTVTASKFGIEVTCEVFMKGYSGVTPKPSSLTPTSILDLLAAFQKSELGKNCKAYLMHYRQFSSGYPSTVDVDPAVFVNLRQFYASVYELSAHYNACPETYHGEFTKEYNEITYTVTASQDRLAIDPALLSDLQDRVLSLGTRIEAVIERQCFFMSVASFIETEPAKGKAIVEGTGQQNWLYGFGLYSKSHAVQIQSMRYESQKAHHGVGYQSHTFQFGPSPTKLIVGWEMISNWHDGTNGSFHKKVDQILLTNQATVGIRSDLARGFHWTMNIYYVDAEDYRFQR